MLNFKQEGLKELHFMTERLNFPIAIPVYTDWEKTLLQYLQNNVKSTRCTSYDICKWCITHKLPYEILYPLSKSAILKNLYKYYKYLQMKFRLKRWQNSYIYNFRMNHANITAVRQDSAGTRCLCWRRSL